MAGSKAFFSFERSIADYLRYGSDEEHGCSTFAEGGELDVNVPDQKRQLQGLVSGLTKIAVGIQRDAHLSRIRG